MRLLGWIVMVACVAGTALNASGAQCYGTRLPARNRLTAGLETYIIADRNLEGSYGEVRSSQQFLTMSYGVFDWLSVDLKGGAGNIKYHPEGADEIDFDTGFAGGYGYRIKVLDAERVKAVLGFQHISVHPRTERIGIGGEQSNKAVLDDWQYSLIASYAAGSCTPYLGTRWSRTDLIHRVEGVRKRKMSDGTKSVGLIGGIDVCLAKDVWLNVEAQALDTEAASASINWAF